MTKATHRESIIHTLGKLPNEKKQVASTQIRNHLSHWLAIHQPNQLGAFVPVRNEPNIWPALKNYATTNALYLPKYNPKKNGYDWALYKEPLTASKFNIPEPATACGTPPTLDACVVPAVGIDPKGHRIGWGHGYFDRLLSTKIPHRIGIIFDCQRISNHIKSDPWDISLTGIITEHQKLKLF